MAQDSWNSRDQEETGCQPPQGPILCANNCGFFGSATTMNLCSKCYQDFVVVEAKATAGTKAAAAAAAAAAATVTVKVVVVETPSSSHSPQAGPSVEETAPPPPPPPPSKLQPNRCLSCRKRVGLAGFTCRCGDVFCSAHRYSDKHNCQFDYHAAAQEAIAKANPVVKAEKLDKI